jgi:hypothetical protein
LQTHWIIGSSERRDDHSIEIQGRGAAVRRLVNEPDRIEAGRVVCIMLDGTRIMAGGARLGP